jgi:MFS family permease
LKIPRSERRPISVTALGHFVLHIAELSFPAVALLVTADLLGKQNAYAKIGFAYFWFSLFFGVTQIAGGHLSDHLGPRKTIWIYLFGSGLSMISLGFAQNYLMLICSLSFVGAFLGLYHPAGMALLSHKTAQHGTSMGLHGMGGNFGLALSPFLASALAAGLGWRNGFIVLGLIPILVSFWPLLDRKLELEPENHAHSDDQANKDGGQKLSLALAPVLILFLMSILNGMCYRGFTTFLPSYFAEKISTSLISGGSRALQAGSFTTLVLILGMAGQFMGGRLADKYPREKLFTAAFLLAVPFLFLVAFLSGPYLILSAMLFALFYFSNQPIVNSLLPQYADRKILGRLYGWFYFMNFGAGAFMAWIAGVIGEKIALNYIFILLSFLLLLAGCLGFILIKLRKVAGS